MPELKTALTTTSSLNDHKSSIDPPPLAMISKSGCKLVGNLLWEMFEMFELTEIMRQRTDKKFAEALNTLGNKGLEGLSNDQVKLLNTRIKRLDEIPEDCIALYHAKVNVQNFNEERINKLPGKLYINLAIDKAMGKDAKKNFAIQAALTCRLEKDINNTCGLPSELRFKCGVKYLVTINQNTSDGIVNGAVGILKHIVLTKNKQEDKPLVKRVYLLFDVELVGRFTRNKQRFNKQDDIVSSEVVPGESKMWTMIEYDTQTIKKLERKVKRIEKVEKVIQDKPFDKIKAMQNMIF
jgi:hypothetical protein